MAFAVGFGGIKRGDAAVERGPMGGDGLGVVNAGPAGLAGLPAAEDDGADLDF